MRTWDCSPLCGILTKRSRILTVVAEAVSFICLVNDAKALLGAGSITHASTLISNLSKYILLRVLLDYRSILHFYFSKKVSLGVFCAPQRKLYPKGRRKLPDNGFMNLLLQVLAGVRSSGSASPGTWSPFFPHNRRCSGFVFAVKSISKYFFISFDHCPILMRKNPRIIKAGKDH